MNDPTAPDPAPETPDLGGAGSDSGGAGRRDAGSGSPSTQAGPTGPTAAPGDGPVFHEERLHRCRHGRMLAGVASGAADYLGIDPTLVRIGFVALAFVGGLAVPLYLAGWLLIPEEGARSSVAEGLLGHERAFQ